MSDKETFSGEVAWFDPNKGFGFIVWEKNGTKQKDMFVHFSDIICDGFKTLDKDDKVSFEVGSNLKGSPKAINVNITEKAKKQK